MTRWRRGRCWGALGIVLACWFPSIAAAGNLSLDGPWVQGGLMIGTTEPGAKVFVDGRSFRV
ncbi:MAG TPA: M23 family peptidase, partial [Rhodospirillales bacterium]|nr:M23 family peptidase [Rhodospirillales bacterium]